MRVLLIVTLCMIGFVIIATLSIPYCTQQLSTDDDDEDDEDATTIPLHGVHVVCQPPQSVREYGVERQNEYDGALEATLKHRHVAMVHALAESKGHERRLLAAVPQEFHRHKLRISIIGRRITFADAVAYANRWLPNRTVLLCNADVSVHGPHWNRLTPALLRGHLFGLTRHEFQGCALQCDCLRKWDGCHDAYAFVPPLLGGDALLEQISFRMGGLWGSENRFMWEVHRFNPMLAISNPCKTFVVMHWHCVGGGRYRPTQDARFMNLEGRSLEPWPSRWKLSLIE